MYAGDVELYHSCNINGNLATINSWASAKGLYINPLKSKCMLILKFGSKINYVRTH